MQLDVSTVNCCGKTGHINAIMPNIFSLGELHLTPLQGIIQLRPNFEYVDRAKDKKASAVKEEGLSHFMRIENK